MELAAGAVDTERGGAWTAGFVNAIGAIPLLGVAARSLANVYREGSVTRIKCGLGAGMAWRRYHRYVNSYWIGNYELEMQKTMARLLRPGAVFYDVGANAGFFSLIAARIVGAGGRVVAIDPLPENVSTISEQLRLNGFENAEVVQCAVGSSRGRSPFSFFPRQSTNGRMGGPVSAQRTVDVEVMTLDDLVRIGRQPDLVKIDVEGAEGDVMAGVLETIRRGTVFLIEIHNPDAGKTVSDLLAAHGYALEMLDGDRSRRGEQHMVGLPPRP